MIKAQLMNQRSPKGPASVMKAKKGRTGSKKVVVCGRVNCLRFKLALLISGTVTRLRKPR